MLKKIVSIATRFVVTCEIRSIQFCQPAPWVTSFKYNSYHCRKTILASFFSQFAHLHHYISSKFDNLYKQHMWLHNLFAISSANRFAHFLLRYEQPYFSLNLFRLLNQLQAKSTPISIVIVCVWATFPNGIPINFYCYIRLYYLASYQLFPVEISAISGALS